MAASRAWLHVLCVCVVALTVGQAGVQAVVQTAAFTPGVVTGALQVPGNFITPSFRTYSGGGSTPFMTFRGQHSANTALSGRLTTAEPGLPSPMSWRRDLRDISGKETEMVKNALQGAFPWSAQAGEGIVPMIENLISDVNPDLAVSLLDGPWVPTKRQQRTFKRKDDGSTELYQNGILSHGIRSALTYVEKASVLQESLPSEDSGEFIHSAGRGIKVVTGKSTLQDGTGSIWISLRGTFNAADWLRSFDSVKCSKVIEGIDLHQGYAYAALNIFKDLKKRKMLKDVGEIRLTGHSAGGAIAQILHLLMRLDGLNVLETVAFASPKITTKKDAERLENLGALDDILRVNNLGDSVPDFPVDLSQVEGKKWAQAGPEVTIAPLPDRIRPFLTYKHAGFDRRISPTIDGDDDRSIPDKFQSKLANHNIYRTVTLLARGALAQGWSRHGTFSHVASPIFQTIGERGRPRNLFDPRTWLGRQKDLDDALDTDSDWDFD